MIRSKKYTIINNSSEYVISDIIKMCKELENMCKSTPFIYCGENIGNIIDSYNCENEFYFIINVYDNGNRKVLGYLSRFRADVCFNLHPNFLIISDSYYDMEMFMNKLDRNKKLKNINKLDESR